MSARPVPAAPPYFTPEERGRFERDGFVVVRGLYGADEVRALAAWVDELAARPPEIGKQMVYFEDSRRVSGARVLSRIEKFVDYHAGLHRVVYAEKLIGRVGELLGEPAVLFKEKINFKLAGGDGFAAHQDIQPGWDEYASYFLTVLVSIDASTVENGCLELAAGHHRRGLIGEKWTPLTAEQLRGVEFRAYPTAPGDAVFFDCFVPHRSAPNDTDQSRRILYLTYNRSSEGDHRERYFADKRRSYPPDHEREPGKEYRFRV
jgi:ectoine hydroxylase-related dioxygenase (phytanoyl-CoA dioxygenase family)